MQDISNRPSMISDLSVQSMNINDESAQQLWV